MFIEKLWEKNPELVIKAIKKICDIDEDLAKELAFQGVDENGYLKFGVRNVRGYCRIYVNDFCLKGDKYIDMGGVRSTHMLSNSVDWMKFMYKIYGDKYVMKYISQRNQQLDEYMAEYEEKYNKQTINMLSELGIKKYQDIQNQTK